MLANEKVGCGVPERFFPFLDLSADSEYLLAVLGLVYPCNPW